LKEDLIPVFGKGALPLEALPSTRGYITDEKMT